MPRLIVDECGEPELTEPRRGCGLYTYIVVRLQRSWYETDRYTLPKWNALADSGGEPAMRMRGDTTRICINYVP